MVDFEKYNLDTIDMNGRLEMPEIIDIYGIEIGIPKNKGKKSDTKMKLTNSILSLLDRGKISFDNGFYVSKIRLEDIAVCNIVMSDIAGEVPSYPYDIMNDRFTSALTMKRFLYKVCEMNGEGAKWFDL